MLVLQIHLSPAPPLIIPSGCSVFATLAMRSRRRLFPEITVAYDGKRIIFAFQALNLGMGKLLQIDESAGARTGAKKYGFLPPNPTAGLGCVTPPTGRFG